MGRNLERDAAGVGVFEIDTCGGDTRGRRGGWLGKESKSDIKSTASHSSSGDGVLVGSGELRGCT
jgi:hypothetical protein